LTAQSAPASPERFPSAGTIPAGGDDRIPRIFLAAADLLVLGIALLGASRFAPAVQRMLLPGGLLGGVLPFWLRMPAVPRPELFPALSEVVWLLPATAPATLLALELFGGYGRFVGQSAVRVATTVVGSQMIALSFSALVVFALKLSNSSRIVIFTYALLSAVGLLVYRGAIWAYQRRRRAHGLYAKNVLVVGQPRAVEWMIEHFRTHAPETDFRLAGWLRASPAPNHAPERRRDETRRQIPLERLGDVEDLGDLLMHHPVHEVIAIQSSVDRDWLRPVMETCEYFRIRLRIVSEALLVGTPGELQLVYCGDPLRLPEVVLAPPNLDADVLVVKRLIDVAISATLLILLAPLFLLIAIAIKVTTPGLPVFYRWQAIGLNGRPFTGYKFTSMVAGADRQKQTLLDRNEMQGPVFKVKNDPRITSLGGFLRKYSLDELPQLWCVLKGDMSLVGPRPALRDELMRYELWHKRKLCVKPGITCLWQVSGRNRISRFDDWVRLDLEYIDRWNLWLDMRILARTVWAVLSGSGS
jgi:exopolysaccharide biosynthesis polyprenyl glycosylphosphotransferase